MGFVLGRWRKVLRSRGFFWSIKRSVRGYKLEKGIWEGSRMGSE